MRGGQIAPDRIHGPRVAVDEHGAARAAGQRLDGERATPRVAVEDVRAREPRRAERAEHRLLDAIGRGTGAHALRDEQAQTTDIAGDDPWPPTAPRPSALHPADGTSRAGIRVRERPPRRRRRARSLR